jgi:hypothetical protein
MKKIILSIFTSVLIFTCFAQLPDEDPSFIGIYVTPIYDSSGPKVNIGKYDKGLSSKSEKEFVSTILKMKGDISNLSVEELYVASVELFNRGFRDESVYWFYKAQLRSRVFNGVLDRSKIGSMGSPAFEMVQFQNSFFQLAGPFINGYGFGDPKKLKEIITKVKEEGSSPLDFTKLYDNVAFIPSEEHEKVRREIVEGLSGFIDYLETERKSIMKQRKESGAHKRFGKLSSKELPES